MGGFNIGDFIVQLVILFMGLLPIILLIVGVVYLVRILKRAEHRAEQRLKLEREYTKSQQEQIGTLKELNNRMKNIEKVLIDVE